MSETPNEADEILAESQFMKELKEIEGVSPNPYTCKKCGQAHSGGITLGRHYKAFPDHRSAAGSSHKASNPAVAPVVKIKESIAPLPHKLGFRRLSEVIREMEDSIDEKTELLAKIDEFIEKS